MNSFFNLVPLVVFIPLAGMLINMVFGRRFSEAVVGTIASVASGSAFVVSVLLAISLAAHPEGVDVPLINWITIGELSIPWAFRVDTLSVTMMLVVSGVGTLIHIYAIGYMHEDVRHNGDPKRYPRFFVYFSLFITMMMILVSANNYMMLFVGWEGVGLCSYLLIGFWYEKGKNGIGNALAAKKAMVVNRVGDFGFLIAAFLMFGAFKSFEFEKVFAAAPEVARNNPTVILLITLFMLIGVTGKSAQLPLYVWLPDAMAGPTPVSALIHAATMVTAGVYLVARSHVLYSLSPQAQNTVALVGAITALFAATIAVGQFDIKKVLAYSTVSQLGFMVAAVGMGAYTAGMFHLVTHAFFKALLFLSAGSVIQGMEKGEHHVEHDPTLKKQLKKDQIYEAEISPARNEAHGVEKHGPSHHFDPQDMRNMGGLRHQMKTTFWVFLMGGLALAGIPIWSGFWSKDEILAEGLQLNFPVYILLTIAAFFTAFYVGRQIIMVFFGQPRSTVAAHAEENPPVMTVPLIILAVLATVGGFLNFPHPSFENFTKWLEHTLSAGAASAAEGAQAAGEAAGGFNPVVAIIATVLAVVGILLAWYLYTTVRARQQALPAMQRKDDPLRTYLGPIFSGMEHKWWIDELYHYVLVVPYIWLADKLTWGVGRETPPPPAPDILHDIIIVGGFKRMAEFLSSDVDLGFIDWVVNWTASALQSLSRSFRAVQTGFVRNYALVLFMGVVVILGYLALR